MKKGRGQTSMEFLILFGFILLMIIPLMMIFFTQSSETQDSLNGNQLRNIGMRIVDKAESMYYMGEPSRTTLRVFFPDKIEEVLIGNREVVFKYRTTTNAVHEIVVVSMINITGSISPSSGVHNIRIETAGDSVSVTDV